MRKILVVYEFFTPAKRAGGIVSSLNNLVRILQKLYEVSVYTSAFDADGSPLMMEKNTWIQQDGCFVYYAEKASSAEFGQILINLKPEVIYLNGLYNRKFSIDPIRTLNKKQFSDISAWICPRGMLQEGALKIKPLKKKIFLKVFKSMSFHKRMSWHATDEQELQDICRIMGGKVRAKLAFDTPGSVPQHWEHIEKNQDSLQLCYLSLITEKKNLYGLLNMIKSSDKEIKLAIFGPVIDKAYWESCQELIKTVDDRVVYLGEVHPQNVREVISRYHYLILPSFGENFGHVIFEALSAGRPVLISDKTPWSAIDKVAGRATPVTNDKKWSDILKECLNQNQDSFDIYCENARRSAQNYIDAQNFEEQYRQLFNS